MRARDVVGKTVASVVQVRHSEPGRRTTVELKEIVFTDGTILRFVVYEHDADYGVGGIVVR